MRYPLFSEEFLKDFLHPFEMETEDFSGSHIEEDENGYFLQLDMPGVKPEDVSITAKDRRLLIEGHRAGRPNGRYRRVFLLPDDVDVEKIEADLKDGVLSLSLPKETKSRERKIDVKEGKGIEWTEGGEPEEKVQSSSCDDCD